MKRIVVVLIVVILGVAACFLLTGPRMRVQPHVRAFQTRMPLLPNGVVPVQPLPALPSVEAAQVLMNPMAANATNLARGAVYYEYYCQFCHGPAGAGDGPVGQSYVPAPVDLRSPRLQAYTDGQLLRAMLAGTGHAPVLPRVVPPEHRWYVVLFVRQLGAEASP